MPSATVGEYYFNNPHVIRIFRQFWLKNRWQLTISRKSKWIHLLFSRSKKSHWNLFWFGTSQSQLMSLLLSITAKEDRSVGTVDLKWNNVLFTLNHTDVWFNVNKMLSSCLHSAKMAKPSWSLVFLVVSLQFLHFKAPWLLK